MKLDLTHEARNVLENAEDVIYEQIDALSEQRDELFYRAGLERSDYKRSQAVEISMLINKLKQAQFALKELNN